MADQITTNPNAARDWAGDIVPGARLLPYATGTTTPVTVFQDSAGTIPHPTPILADDQGIFPQIFFTGAIKIIATDPDGVVLPGYPLDPAPRSIVGTSGASTISFLPTVAIPETDVQAAIERVQTNIGVRLGTGIGFLTRGTGVANLRTRIISGDGTSVAVADGDGDDSFPVIATIKASQSEAEAGANANATMTPLRTEQHMLANALGWGQTVTRFVTGTGRVANVSYQNTTGRPIYWSFSFRAAGGGSQARISPDGTNWEPVAAAGGAAHVNGSTVVPSGWYYGFSSDVQTGDAAFDIWTELR